MSYFKKAFTMLELVMVILIVGIITVATLPSFDRNNLREAADQVISHIRYTQHLAMMDNRFDSSDSQWFRGRWQIRFYEDLSFTNSTCPTDTAKPATDFQNVWAYTIYSDSPAYSNNPNKSEMARDPSDPNRFLSGGYNNTLCVTNDDNNPNELSSEDMRLNSKFGIDDIAFSGGCRSNVMYLSFDYMGRPFNSFPNTNTPYQFGTGGFHRLLSQACDITLSIGADSQTIRIEPETGYAYIL